MAQSASSQKASYSDFLQQALGTEVAAWQARSRSTLARLAGFPAIKRWLAFELLARDEAATSAIPDRLLHKARVLNIKGRSYRL